MKKTFLFLSSFMIIVALSAFTYQAALNWKIDSGNALVKFSLQAHGVETKGSFTGVKGDIIFDKANLASSSFKVTIDASSVNTGDKGRDNHLRKNDFFGVETYPRISFTSTKIIEEINSWVANGNLTIRDVTKEVTIPFTFETNDNKGVFKGSFEVNRTEYGVGKSGKEVGDIITMNLEVPVEK